MKQRNKPKTTWRSNLNRVWETQKQRNKEQFEAQLYTANNIQKVALIKLPNSAVICPLCRVLEEEYGD